MKTSFAFLILSLAFSFTFATVGRAAELPMGWTSARALGMGNAFIAVADNSDAIFYNPANLCRIKGIHWTAFDPHLGINGLDKVAFLQDVSNASSDIPGTINKLYGKNIWAGAGSKTAITIPCFGVGGFANGEAGFFAQNPANTKLNLNYYFDYGVTMAGGIPIVPGVWTLGVAARRVNRTGAASSIGAGTLAQVDRSAFESEFKRRGTGYGLDVGTTLTLPGPVKPSLSFVYRDLGYTSFSHDEGAGSPPRVEPEMIFGGAFEIDAPLITITPAVDYRYANKPGVALGKNLNLGVEIALPLLSLRAGLHQGYYTAGVGVDFGILQADIATWGVELGEYAGQQEDRRYMAQLTIQLGFDPSLFGILGGGSGSGDSGSSGSRGSGEFRRLKQRR